MGALSRPGPQLGTRGQPEPRAAVSSAQPFGPWFLAFLKNELTPYPGRATLVARMTIAATLTMLIIMTFRLPGAAIAAYYTLLLSRESPTVTVRSALIVLVAYVLGATYTMLGVLLFIDYPLTHFLWVVVSVFLCFFVIKITTNYVAGAAFAFIITIAVPLWDTPLPTSALVVATLWTAGSVSVGLFCTVVVEYLFAGFEPADELHSGLVTRVTAVSAYLRQTALGNGNDKAYGRVQQLAIVGVSRLRRLAANLSPSNRSPERRSTTVSLVGRVVDLAAALEPLRPTLDAKERDRLVRLAEQLDTLLKQVGRQQPTAPPPVLDTSGEAPLVVELERTIGLLQLSLSSPGRDDAGTADPASATTQTTLVPDAFTNPEHLLFSLRGCLAAMLCYVVFNAIAWRGLSTSLATCVITALTSIGSSRQKQVLRLSGAACGGLLFGIGSQILILPMLDTIAGFAVLFVVVTVISAWISTSSPRLSYFGQQVALAFYLIHLQEFYPQTNLAIARDRVMGVALGLLMMWLVFDTLGSRPAAQVMRDLFASNLRLLAELARPWRNGQAANLAQLRELRDKVSANFGSVNAQADAVLFELGPERERDLQLREAILALQPKLRSIFLTEVALLQYRAEIRLEELAPEVLSAQTHFDQRVHQALVDTADAFAKRKSLPPGSEVEPALQDLERAILQAYGGKPTQRAQGILALSRSMSDQLAAL